MSQEEKNKAVVRRLIEDCFNGRDLSLLPELMHPEFVNHQDLAPVECKKGPGYSRNYTQGCMRVSPILKSIITCFSRTGTR